MIELSLKALLEKRRLSPIFRYPFKKNTMPHPGVTPVSPKMSYIYTNG